MLLEIAGGVRGGNADLADRLDTDQWQVSRAGRRLRELGLATRERAGRLTGWTLTKVGVRAVTLLRTGSPRQ
jgi:Mn-dependent DtxR family transcriptional regulator